MSKPGRSLRDEHTEPPLSWETKGEVWLQGPTQETVHTHAHMDTSVCTHVHTPELHLLLHLAVALSLD